MKSASPTSKPKYKTLVVDKVTVREVWDLPGYGNTDEGVEVISDEITDTSRWSVHYLLTVRIKGVVYQTQYSRGATESQEEMPWEYQSEVTFTEVSPVEKIVIDWVPVPVEA